MPEAQRERTVLVVDDDPDVREYAVNVLEELGYAVLSAADGQAALSLLDAGTPVDLLFTDVVMPGLNGFEVARRAVKQFPELKVLFASGYVNGLPPVGKLLNKPYRPAQLATEVASALGD